MATKSLQNNPFKQSFYILDFYVRSFDPRDPLAQNYILTQISETCRWEISQQYLQESLDKSNLGLVITFPQEFYVENYAYDKAAAFALATDNGDGTGQIHLICAMPIYSEKLANIRGDFRLGEVPFRFGLFLHCRLIDELQRRGVREIYLDAATQRLVDYYARFGYRLGKERCGVDDVVTQQHQWYLGLSAEDKLSNPLLSWLPADYESVKGVGFRMKLCHLIEARDMCSMSHVYIQQALDFVDKYQLDDFYTTS